MTTSNPQQSPAAIPGRFCATCGSELNSNVCPRCLLRLGMETQTRTAGPTWVPFVPPGVASLSGRLAGLEVLELIGQGGMGAVYKGRQTTLDRLVAIKVLPVAEGADSAFSERFAREARALAKLCHPNIVAVYDFGRTGDLFYFVMEYVQGVNLRQMLRAGTLKPEDALRIVPQVCEALQYAHDQGIVHRDIKPENILIDAQGRVKIADFGLAKLVGAAAAAGPGHAAQDLTLTAEGHVLGTPRYMAPEQIERPATVDHRVDIYSLGVVLYEMLTGELPLGRFAPPSQKVQVDVRLDEVVLRTLEKEPARRYQHASDVKTDLGSLAGPPPAAAEQPPDFRQFPQLPQLSAGANPDEARWLRRPAGQRRAIKFALYVAMVLGLVMCFSFQASGGPRGQFIRSVEIGFPDTWIHYSPTAFAIELLHWSLWIGIAAVVCLSILVRIERAERHEKSAGLQKPAGAAARRSTVISHPANPANPAGSAYTLPPGAGPMLLLCAGGIVVGGLCMTAGLALGVLAFLQAPPGSGAFWGWMGSAFGCFFGGGGALAGSWNTYRQLTGRRDLMSEPHWTLLDRTLATYTWLGVLLLAADGAVWRVAGGATRYALLLLGGMVCVQGVLFLITRAAMRHAARERERA